MAKARRVEPAVESHVVLKLTLEEATTLRLILGAVGGSPTVSRRKHADRIAYALDSAGFTDGRFTRNGGSGGLAFGDAPYPIED